jgi:ergothioneine biosynthesis protein EgtB
MPRATTVPRSQPRVQPREGLAERFDAVRTSTGKLVDGLSAEDMVVQSMPDASPAKWHLAHTTWFFEEFVLTPGLPGYRRFHPDYAYLFNSYYEQIGERHARPMRGMLTRPGVNEVRAFREHVDAAMTRLMDDADDALWQRVAPLIELGLHHEQQHQELLLTDLLHLFSLNPLAPAYRAPAPRESIAAPAADWVVFDGGIHAIGHDGQGFAFDHESPRHEVLLRPFKLATRPVSNGQWQDFIADGGYDNAALWLSDGWTAVQAQGWKHPLYWRCVDGAWSGFGLRGQQPLDEHAPVSQVSYFEADAFARWAGCRLPTEQEWEVAADGLPVAGNTVGSGLFRPVRAAPGRGLLQMYGDVWEWTQSAYAAYPGYRAPAGAVGEYNGKFMCGQYVLRGGSCASPEQHLRASYRNFFHPDKRWQFSGLRLAEDA